MEKMMKKLMFALIAALFCSSLMAQVLIYDYAASFKRIDVKSPVKVSYKPEGADHASVYGLDSPKVVNDKFTGYMVIEACEECGGAMLLSAELGKQAPGNPAVVYIKRNGNKSAVYRAIGRFEAGMFGAKAGLAHSWDTQWVPELDAAGNPTGRMIQERVVVRTLVNPKKFTDAYGFLSYNINANGQVDYLTNTKVNGFMGFGHTGMPITSLDNWWADNYASLFPAESGLPEHWFASLGDLLAQDFDTVDHAGYGKVKVLTTELDCLDENSCYVVNNLSGSMLGGFTYTGYCSDFLVDVCDPWVYAHLAPISGTFTLKLNNKLTFQGKEYKNGTFAAAEKTVASAIGASATNSFADPLETLEFNMWLELRGEPTLSDYYYWYSKDAKKAVVDTPSKSDYPATTAALNDFGANWKKITKIEVDETAGTISYTGETK